MRSLVASVAALFVVASCAFGQVGSRLPQAELVDFRLTEATSIEDFDGRLILIEFFAHW